MAELKKKLKKRTGHRAFITHTLKLTRDCIDNKKYEQNHELAIQLKNSLTDQLEAVEALDPEILDLLTEEVVDDDDGDAMLFKEIKEAGTIKAEIKTALHTLEKVLGTFEKASSSTVSVNEVENGSSVGLQKVHANLPKLEMPKFSGRPEQWQEFWDTFESSVHNNQAVAEIDKFAYLRRYVTDSAKACIAGFRTTAANYKLAIEALQKRFGKKSVIQQAHINALLNISPVFNDWDAARLRKLYDAVECNHRGLQALDISSVTYQSIVVPAIVKKLPEGIRLQLTRGKEINGWSVDDLLDELRTEVELREEHSRNGARNEKRTPRDDARPITASTLTTTANLFCAFCKGNHAHHHCKEVTSVSHRKQLIRKYGRCFICMQRGHKATNCTSKYSCAVCKGRHHISICESPREKEQATPREQVNSIESSVSPSLHVAFHSSIVLQTAQALVEGKDSPVKVRVLFDSGSQLSFVRSRVVESAGLQPKRKEWLEVSTFGQQVSDGGLKEVFDLDIRSVDGKSGHKIEAFAVERISSIKNEHVERRKKEYNHLKGVWFSDICKDSERLEIDILIGSDYLWCFQGGRTIRGEPNDPVAVETKLGWVLSGPLKGERDRVSTNVNFVNCRKVDEKLEFKKAEGLESLEQSVKKLWDLETVGIQNKGNDVHEALKDEISFNGERYVVGLPWKEGHKQLPSNYYNSLKRLKGQIHKLQQDPDTLIEYDRVIKDQLEKSIIEPVCDLEEEGKLFYLPHHPVIRKEAKTTKLRVVYDASAKEGGRGVSLNDCLHVGPALTPHLYDVLVRFREKRIAIVGDIEKAFLNVEIAKKDRDSLRFLWVDDINSKEIKPVEYRFCRVVFGVNCSPFLLNATVQYHLDTFAEEDPQFVESMKRSLYVDDWVGAIAIMRGH